ncbi:hypothetical protein LTR50_006876 [Elasticomyces elasticus]|nr:hypothetical protein LTR50_006876 [Elasticomyces elasticus]
MFYKALLIGGLALSANAQVNLGTAAPFGVLAASAITNTGLTVVGGQLGIYPNGVTSITGFPPGISGTVHGADAVAKQAQADATTAYNAAMTLASTKALTGQDLGGMVLPPGVYTFSSSAGLTGILTLDAQGNSNAQWVFQIGSTITTASASSVVLINGANACNVFWQVGSSATLGTGTMFAGNIIALASITVTTGSSNNGGLYALTAAVTLDDNMLYGPNHVIYVYKLYHIIYVYKLYDADHIFYVYKLCYIILIYKFCNTDHIILIYKLYHIIYVYKFLHHIIYVYKLCGIYYIIYDDKSCISRNLDYHKHDYRHSYTKPVDSDSNRHKYSHDHGHGLHIVHDLYFNQNVNVD